jgi:MFS family permease
MTEIVTKYFFRPVQMLTHEPILALITLYSALIYGLLYLTFFAYPIAFQKLRGWEHPGTAALPFIGIFVGILCGCLLSAYWNGVWYARKMREQGHVVPEERLPLMLVAAVSLPVGLFWFGWTSKPTISWVPQAVAGVPIGLGIIIIFLQGINYLVDVYTRYTNSAMAGNTFVRGVFGAVFPLFASHLYNRLGVAWATSFLGFVTAAMIPVPLLFYKYGPRIRAKSRFNPNR